MYVGVNTLTIEPGRGGGEEHYLRHLLATVRKVHPDVRFVAFTDPANHDSFEGWNRIFLRRPSELERATKRAGIDVLFTPLRTALPKSPVPQIPFAMDLLSVREMAGKRHRRAAARLKAIQRICREAPAIVTPSQFLQRECLELLDVPLD